MPLPKERNHDALRPVAFDAHEWTELSMSRMAVVPACLEHLLPESSEFISHGSGQGDKPGATPLFGSKMNQFTGIPYKLVDTTSSGIPCVHRSTNLPTTCVTA